MDNLALVVRPITTENARKTAGIVYFVRYCLLAINHGVHLLPFMIGSTRYKKRQPSREWIHKPYTTWYQVFHKWLFCKEKWSQIKKQGVNMKTSR